MDLNEFKKGCKKDKIITVRTTKKDYDWMKKNQIKPSKVFHKILAELKKSKKN